MSSELSPLENSQASPLVEVEFALVIARMLDSINGNPAEMRQAVYELARHKLREQFTKSEEYEKAQQALETAIVGVENFHRQRSYGTVTNRLQNRIEPLQTQPWLSNRLQQPKDLLIEADAHQQLSNRKALLSRWKRTATILFFVGLAAVAFHRRDFVIASVERYSATIKKSASILVAQKSAQVPPPAPATVITQEKQTERPATLLPTEYGVYAVTAGKLTSLTELPIRAPDPRVAISAMFTIQKADQIALSDTRPKFVVFQRERPSTDKFDVRMVARVAREFSKDKSSNEISNEFIIRNISWSYRSGPVADHADMYEIQHENGSMELSPGRYVLIIKNRAYFFEIEGPVSDPRQCIERVVSATGIFYSDCRNP